MDEEPSSNIRGCFFRIFVLSSLATLLGIHIYGYLGRTNGDSFDGDFSDIKYVVMQLTRGLTEVNRKHDQLKNEMERISTAIPKVAAATARARDALQAGPGCKKAALEADYDRQVFGLTEVLPNGPNMSCGKGSPLPEAFWREIVLPYNECLQITDFALESAGARILDTGDTVSHVVYESSMGYFLHALTSLLCRGGHECLNARAMLRPGSLPGECWAFRGTQGQATIRLLGTIRVAGVSLEHIPPHISPTKDISSAPRVFQVEGLTSRYDDFPHDFGTFEYNREGRPIQYFEVQHHTQKGYNIVRLRILSNWGNPVYTCVYRFRVHGELAQSQNAPHIGEDDTRIENEL